jgi:hypothetical protein
MPSLIWVSIHKPCSPTTSFSSYSLPLNAQTRSVVLALVVVHQPDPLDLALLLGQNAAHVAALALDLGEAPDLRGGPGVGERLGVGLEDDGVVALARVLGGPALLEEVVLELGDLLESVIKKINGSVERCFTAG